MHIVQHIGLNCRDREAQEQFYEQAFGFRRVRTFNEGLPEEFVMLRLGDTCLELFAADKHVNASGGEQPVGFKHLAFQVPDLKAKVKALRQQGIQVDPITDCSTVVPGLRVTFFNDPEGNRIELMEGWQDED
jgi:glyoxylase I family protein